MLLESLDINKNRNMIFQAGEGAGNSGSFFFFSKDNKLLIKAFIIHKIMKIWLKKSKNQDFVLGKIA